MMLGTDVSSLSTTAVTAAAQGLSIVVPLYNEAAGLSSLHQRLCDLAKALNDRHRLACEVVYVDDGSSDATLVDRARAHSPMVSTFRSFRCRATSARKQP